MPHSIQFYIFRMGIVAGAVLASPISLVFVIISESGFHP